MGYHCHSWINAHTVYNAGLLWCQSMCCGESNNENIVYIIEKSAEGGGGGGGGGGPRPHLDLINSDEFKLINIAGGISQHKPV